MNLYIALVHYPVVNRRGDLIASAITNLDLHDLARAACTYGVPACYIVTPLTDQRALAQTLIRHWTERVGKAIHPDRELALRRLQVVDSIQDAIETIEAQHGAPPLLWATTAKQSPNALSHQEARQLLRASDRPCLLLLGTAWGLADSVMATVDGVLQSVDGVNGYNHLSVRCAAAILMDRLLGRE